MTKSRKIEIICLAIIIGIIYIFISSNNYLALTKDSVDVEYLGNEKYTDNGASFDLSDFKGAWSLITFNSVKDNKITIKNNSKITKGKLHIQVLDSNRKIIIIDKSSKKDLKFTTPKDGEYIIRIAGRNISGKFDIEINSDLPIKLSHYNIYGSKI
ncbi:hypothetical protein [Clostridium sp. Marseille-Q2269]|uniref:hypothetical protein n=1 Tax=Clostridium sp. Marseille-Q2269 TaxID=2942205 RepID=UPI0020734F8D|nr:hypothetical protein [Clostridium sp. Marseille-Q2269]